MLLGSGLDGSDLAGSDLAGSDLAGSDLAGSDLAASRDASSFVASCFAASPRTACSGFGGSSMAGLPRLPCFCLAPDLLSVAACAGVCPSSAGLVSGAICRRENRLASRPGRVPSPCGWVPSASGLEASRAGAAGGCRRPSRSGWSALPSCLASFCFASLA
ncbi:pentapeptide repeat-containing protein [Bradyrhizobium archetypum]|uniref:pentapeptide repeat-containing protein n=1 Tax=Bradyrhizobium archetypum TaxID=2721160 RepID=UPI0035DA301B